MGALSAFERRLSGLVEGTFAKMFKGWAEPVQIAGALQRELDTRKVMSSRRSMVPNSFVVDLSDRDHERLSPYAEDLGLELASMVREHAEEQRYSFAGPVTVHLAHDGKLDTGVFRIHSDVNADGTISADQLGVSPRSTPAVAPPPPLTRRPPLSPPPPPYRAEPQPDRAELPFNETQVFRAPAPASELSTGGASFLVSYAGSDLQAADRSFPLVAAVTRIGRAHDVDLRVDDSAVSRNHAEVRRLPEGKGHLLVDLGSTNGTTVNGRRVQTWELREDDRVQLGAATLTYRPDPLPASAGPSADDSYPPRRG